MKLTRDEIVGDGFAQAADGWHRGDVLRHLNAIAAAVEDLRSSGEAPAAREGDESARREAQELLAAARAEADTIRARAAEDAEHQMNQAQLAVKDLLERVASLNLGVEEARRTVEERGQEMARRLEESAEPFVGAMRERTAALGAEVELMATGLAVSARATEPEPEHASQPLDDGAGEVEVDDPAPSAAAPPSGPDPGTGLSPSDLDEAADEIAAGAAMEPPAPDGDEQTAGGTSDDNGRGSQAGLERARLVALNMALGGASEEETGRRLRDELGIDDPAKILADAYGRNRESQ